MGRPMRRFEFCDQTSNKFWEIEQDGLALVARWGRIGASGQVARKVYGSEAAAAADLDKQARSKLAKGYVEIDVEEHAPAVVPVVVPVAATPAVAAPKPVAVEPAAATPVHEPAGARRFECREAGSHKFWEIERDGIALVSRWGKIGASGQATRKAYASEAAAAAELDKQARAKLAKGYVEITELVEPARPIVAKPIAAPPTVVPRVVPAEPVAPEPVAPEPVAPEPVAASDGDLPDGGEIQVAGSGSSVYTLRNVGGAYSCTCPAWRNQSLPSERRTCKHLRKFRGDAVEQARLGSELPQRARASAGRSSSAAGTKPDTGGVAAPPLLLAHSFKRGDHDPTGWWLSEKLDGVRAYWDGKQFVSRLGNGYLAPEWFTAGLPDFPLDGELFAGRGRFQQTVSIARRMDRGDGWKSLRYLVFDAPGLERGFEDRIRHLEDHFGARPWPQAHVLEHRVCAGHDDLDAELRRVEALGGEGLMLRRPGSRYVAGRSDTLLKVKTFLDREARVTGYQAGTGKHKGRVGALLAELPNGTKFKIGTGLSDAERDDPPAIGEIVTVRYQELTDAGVPRFPSYVGIRADVDWDALVAALRDAEA